MCREKEKKKKILGFYVFLGCPWRTNPSGPDEFVLGYQKKNGTICVKLVYYRRVDRNLSNGFRHGWGPLGRPRYSQTSPSPIISNLNGRSIALCRASSSACSIVISAWNKPKSKSYKRISRIVLDMSCTHIILMVADIIKLSSVNFSWKFVQISRTKLHKKSRSTGCLRESE